VYSKSSRRVFASHLVASAISILAFVRSGGAQSSDKKPKNDDTGGNDKVYEPGAGVTWPKLIHYVEPSFSTKGSEAFVEGIVTVSMIVSTRGVPSDLHIMKGLNADEDRSALEALKQWRFEPGTKDSKPVNVRVKVEVGFHLL
jgi:periplasmic protein TonB